MTLDIKVAPSHCFRARKPGGHQACVPKETRKAIQLFQRGTGASDEVRWLFRGEKVFFLLLAHVLVKWNMGGASK